MYLVALLASRAAAQCFSNTGNASWDVAPAPPVPLNLSTGGSCACGSFAAGSCCSDAYVAAVKAGPGNIYKGWTFDQCGRTMGAACRAFMDAQECSFACDPRTAQNYWDLYYNPNTFQPIKVCGSYCDAWFDACKNELTCASNWGTFPNDPVQGYVCNASAGPAPFQTCKTFAETFGNGQGLCGLNPTFPTGKKGLWDIAYTYDTSAQWCVAPRRAGSPLHSRRGNHSLTTHATLPSQLLLYWRPGAGRSVPCPRRVPGTQRRAGRDLGRRHPCCPPGCLRPPCAVSPPPPSSSFLAIFLFTAGR